MTQDLTKRFPRGKSRELSYACWQYSHKRCKGMTCKCDCHEKKEV